MPTPDTETLAARLRAVERALTDETADRELDTGRLEDDTPDDGESEAVDSNEPDGPQHSEEPGRPDVSNDIRHRLRRLEATVQALKAALDGDPTAGADSAAGPSPRPSAGAESRSTDPTAAESLPDDPQNPAPTGRHQNGPRQDRSAPDGDWPDDLATE